MDVLVVVVVLVAAVVMVMVVVVVVWWTQRRKYYGNGSDDRCVSGRCSGFSGGGGDVHGGCGGGKADVMKEVVW